MAEGSDFVAAEEAPVRQVFDSGALTLTLDRPARKNALTAGMIATLTGAIEDAADDDRVRVIVIRSEGRDFCTGIDLVESNRPGRGKSRAVDGPTTNPTKPRAGHLQRSLGRGAHRLIQAVASVQIPVVCGVQGWAAGIGNSLALSADVTIAASSARFWVPFVSRGFTPDSATTWLLPRLVGVARAKQMLLLGKPVDGETAASWGLVSDCVPDDQLERAVAEVAAELKGAATVALGLTKALLLTNLESGLAAALQNEAIYEELGVRSDDFKEGLRAFSDKRPPEFTGW